ncbi:hypothetical protein B0H13DRAFT_2325090 [Mycena leptocephala]|nr:hypothetical protein B0H13DRAFT_2325090 [Mycena leptocephala]
MDSGQKFLKPALRLLFKYAENSQGAPREQGNQLNRRPAPSPAYKVSRPWRGLAAATKEQKYDLIMQKKMTIHTDGLCRGFPVEFGTFLDYTRGLGFDEEPDYSYWTGRVNLPTYLPTYLPLTVTLLAYSHKLT